MGTEGIMSTKTSSAESTSTSTSTEEFKDQNLKHNFSKFEYDLYHEEDDVSEKVIRVKRFSVPNKGERWKVFEDNKVVFIVEGSKLLKKEREYLQTIDGFNFILAQAKQGIKSLNGLKAELKKAMDKVVEEAEPKVKKLPKKSK
jgi:hypothetical protein